MRVDNQVWYYTLSCEGKIFLSIEHTNCALLTMATGKLITDLRDPLGSHLDLGETLPQLIHSDCHLVDLSCLRMFDGSRTVFSGLAYKLVDLVIRTSISEISLLNHGSLSDDDVIPTDLCSRANQPINI